MSRTPPIRVLISAVDGDVGQAIVKSLRISGRSFCCHGCDMVDNEIGKLFVDSFHLVPSAKDNKYLQTINTLAIDLGIDAFIPASEQEITILNELTGKQLPCGIPIICQDSRIISMFGDKLACMRALDGKVSIACYADGHDIEAVKHLVDAIGFPLIVKERLSSGSKSINIVNSPDDLQKAIRVSDFPLVQEYIDDNFGEFSIGIFSDSRSIETIAFLRRLGLTGASWYAETSSDAEVIEYAEKIARVISPRGSINIQVRKGSKGVKLLEVNPRFSSLAAARAICGFNDVVWSLDLALNGKYSKERTPYKKIRFKRYISELIDFGDGFKKVSEWLPEKKNEVVENKR